MGDTGCVRSRIHYSDATETRLDFSNTLSKSQIEEMATVDEFEVVKEVQVGSSVLCREEED